MFAWLLNTLLGAFVLGALTAAVIWFSLECFVIRRKRRG
jgi:arginine exporter protein ArgO